MAFGAQFKTVQTGTISLDGSGDGTSDFGTGGETVTVTKAWVEMNPPATTIATASAVSIYLSDGDTVTFNGGSAWASAIVSFVVFEVF